jgi:hypothetical protein
LFQAPPDIPLSLGDLVGRSFRTFREQFRFIVTTLLWPTILSTVSIAGIRWCLAHWLSTQLHDLQSVILHILALVLSLTMLCVAQWELALRSVAILRVVLGLDSDYAAANFYARRRKWVAVLVYNVAIFLPIIVLTFWTALSVLFVVNLSHQPFSQITSLVFFSLVGLASTCTLCWTLLCSALSFTILACEDLKFADVCVRTFELMRIYLWRGGSFIILLTLTLMAVTMALDLPMLAFSLFDAWRNNFSATDMQTYADKLPVYVLIMSGVWDSVINLVLLGVALIANGFYYQDLCLRLEGRDIQTRLEKLEAKPISPLE